MAYDNQISKILRLLKSRRKLEVANIPWKIPTPAEIQMEFLLASESEDGYEELKEVHDNLFGDTPDATMEMALLALKKEQEDNPDRNLFDEDEQKLLNRIQGIKSDPNDPRDPNDLGTLSDEDDEEEFKSIFIV